LPLEPLAEVNKFFLEYAAIGKVGLAEKMLEMGASLNARGANGFTALHVAAANGHADMLKYLIRQGCDQDALSDFGDVALMVAIREKNAEAAAVLMRRNVNFAHPETGMTPLMTAIAVQLRVVTDLLGQGARPDTQDKEGKTAAIWAAESNDAKTLSLLVSLGADIFIADSKGRTAYDAALEADAPEAAALLLPQVQARRASLAAAAVAELAEGVKDKTTVLRPLSFRH
jgi:ankyrin repeat protein